MLPKFPALVFVVAIPASQLIAQPAARRLLPAEKRLTETFSNVVSVRELSDGTVLIADAKENRVAHANFNTDFTRDVGSRGNGPGEYVRVAQMYAAGRDSTIMSDGGTLRWVIFDGVRGVGSRMPVSFPNDASRRWFLRGIDGQGRMTVIEHGIGANVHRQDVSTPGPAIYRVDLRTGRHDSVGVANWFFDPELRGASRSTQAAVARSGGAVRASTNPQAQPRRVNYSMFFRVMDQIAVAPDGWIAIARYSPYRVDWCNPELQCRTGQQLPHRAGLLTDKDKSAILRVSFNTAQWPRTDKPSEVSGWSDSLPPFVEPLTERGRGSAVMITPQGDALIWRLPNASLPATHYDLVDRTGRLKDRLSLPMNATIVGFGAKNVYVVTTDSDGLQQIARHPWRP